MVILSMLRISCSRKEKGPDINGAAKRRRYRQRKVLRNKACLSNETETREDPHRVEQSFYLITERSSKQKHLGGTWTPKH